MAEVAPYFSLVIGYMFRGVEKQIQDKGSGKTPPG